MDSLRVWVTVVLICAVIVGGSLLLLTGRVAVVWFISLFVIGLVIGGLIISLTEGRGGLALTWTLVAAVIGSVLGGILLGPLGVTLFSAGPAYIASLIAAALGAVVLILLSRLVTKAFA